ncbi:MAG: hypothetical protein ABSA52_15215 [Candidatus Binatia bacterium]|jgi:hypothetical protein
MKDFWFVGQVGSIGPLLVQFLLTVMIAAILYPNGERDLVQGVRAVTLLPKGRV